MTYTPIFLGMSNVGNTSGVTGTVSNQLVLAGGNNVTLSQSTSGGSATITISAAGGGGAAGTNTIGISNLGNTVGTSGVVTGSNIQFAFAGGNNVTLSQSINASSATITISAADGGFSAGMSTGGNTSGDTGVATNQIVFAGGDNITLSQSTAAGGNTITISGAAGGGAAVTYNSTVFGKQHAWAMLSSSMGQNSMYIFPENLENNVSGRVIKMPVIVVNSSTAVASVQRGLTADLGIYIRHSTNSTLLTRGYSTSYTLAVSHNSNVSWALSMITGVGNSTSYNTLTASSAGLNLSASLHGPREFVFPLETAMTPGEYWFAFRNSSSSAGSTGAILNLSYIIASSSTANRLGVSANASSPGIARDIGYGIYSVTTGAMPAAVSMTQILKSAVNPIMYFLNVTD